MAIPITGVHAARVAEQLTRNLVGLQRDIAGNAATHRTMALAQSPPLGTLQTFLADSVTSYRQRLTWVDLFLTNTDPQFLRAVLVRVATWHDVALLVQALRAAVDTLDAAPLASYADIISACNVTVADVTAPPSLWPE